MLISVLVLLMLLFAIAGRTYPSEKLLGREARGADGTGLVDRLAVGILLLFPILLLLLLALLVCRPYELRFG